MLQSRYMAGREGRSRMDWEIALLLFMGMPFAIVNWTISGLAQLKKSIADRLAAPRTLQEPCS